MFLSSDEGFSSDLLFVRSDSLQCVVFDPQNPNILASCCWDKTIKIWDITSGSCLLTLRGHDCKEGCLCRRDGFRQIILNPDCPVSGHDGIVFSVCFSPDGKKIASSGQDETVRIWDAATGAAVGSPLRGHWYVPFPCIECLLS